MHAPFFEWLSDKQVATADNCLPWQVEWNFVGHVGRRGGRSSLRDECPEKVEVEGAEKPVVYVNLTENGKNFVPGEDAE